MVKLVYSRNSKNRSLKTKIERFFIGALKVATDRSSFAKIEDNFSGKFIFFLVKENVCGKKISDYVEIAAYSKSSLYAICLFTYEVIFPLFELDDKTAYNSCLQYILNGGESFLEENDNNLLQKFCNEAYRIARKDKMAHFKEAIENDFFRRIQSK